MADFLALDAAARAYPFLCTQLVQVRGDGKVREVLNPAPPFAPIHPPQLLFRFRMGGKIRGVDRLTVHRLGEAEKQLRQVALGLETVRARTVIPFLQAIEFYLQTQILQVQIVGTLLLLSGPLLVLISLQQQRPQYRLQGLTVVG
ncbi:MAG: hypothetical protein ABSG62_24070 [Terracidiphilus sp.]|jgi:hypothetical protein